MSATETKTAHTPGPWRIERFRGVPDQIIGAGDKEIASLYATDGLDEPSEYPVEANARLIAAAPDLLAALKSLSNHLMLETIDREWIADVVDTAIAKATGATP